MVICDAWLNGVCVGEVQIYKEINRAEIHCNLPHGWIYRAVLLFNNIVIGRFGVLIPQLGIFKASAKIETVSGSDELFHCEVLKACPGGKETGETWMTLDQCCSWETDVFLLKDTIISLVMKKSNVQYRIYNMKKYLLFPLELEKADLLVEIFCLGRIFILDGKHFLCVNIGSNGEIIPWQADEM